MANDFDFTMVQDSLAKGVQTGNAIAAEQRAKAEEPSRLSILASTAKEGELKVQEHEHNLKATQELADLAKQRYDAKTKEQAKPIEELLKDPIQIAIAEGDDAARAEQEYKRNIKEATELYFEGGDSSIGFAPIHSLLLNFEIPENNYAKA